MIWQRRASACTGSRAVMRRRRASVGTAAEGARWGAAGGGVWAPRRRPRLERRRFRTRPGSSSHRRLVVHPLEERVERGVRLGASVETSPQHAQLADELVADVDRYEVALGLAGM